MGNIKGWMKVWMIVWTDSPDGEKQWIKETSRLNDLDANWLMHMTLQCKKSSKWTVKKLK